MNFLSTLIRPANSSFACSHCRLVLTETETTHYESCPDCGQSMHNMGAGFIAPHQSDQAEWEKVNLLIEHNFTFEYLPA